MNKGVGAWERPASIYLVDTTTDREKLLPLLLQLEEEHKELVEVEYHQSVLRHLALAYNNLNDQQGRKFLLMLAWDHTNQTFLPFASECFDDDDCELIVSIIQEYITVAFRCCCQGFEFTNINTENKLLGYLVQALCENEMMQIEIRRLKELN